MCGRYVSPEVAAMEREYRVDRRNSATRFIRALENLNANYNVAPTQWVWVIRETRENGILVRETLEMRWGLIPKFADGIPPKYPTMIARVERIESAPYWRGPWKEGKRCIMPCRGFYEWKQEDDGSKTPYYIYPSDDDSTFAMAGLWDESETLEGEKILSCAVITMPANALLADIHNTKQRMPAIMHREDIDTWLHGTCDDAKKILQQYPPELMRAHAVRKSVNSTKNNGPELIQPFYDPDQPSLF